MAPFLCSPELRFLPLQGKGLFATRSIRKGETVFVERPVVASQFLWNALYNYRGEAKIYRQIDIFFSKGRGFRLVSAPPGVRHCWCFALR